MIMSAWVCRLPDALPDDADRMQQIHNRMLRSRILSQPGAHQSSRKIYLKLKIIIPTILKLNLRSSKRLFLF